MALRPAKGGQRRLYQCLRCPAKSMHRAIEFSRASRPHCPACGATALEPAGVEGKEEALRRSTQLVIQDGTSLHRASRREQRPDGDTDS
jgi:hypothetical protein